MNIQQVLDRQLPEPEEVGEARRYFVAPSPDTLPDDGVLNYIVVANVFELKDAPERSVLLFSQNMERLLSILCANQEVFGLSFQCMVGLPMADYSVTFDQASWSLDKVSYAPLISEIALSIEVDAQAKASNMSLHDRERARVTRANGDVKRHSAFDLAVDDDVAPEEDA